MEDNPGRGSEASRARVPAAVVKGDSEGGAPAAAVKGRGLRGIQGTGACSSSSSSSSSSEERLVLLLMEVPKK